MSDEPQHYNFDGTLGHLTVHFKGEKFSGEPILDTSVIIEGTDLCWITWEEKEMFLDELNAVLEKYRI